jgi:voltage-gated potassium channel
VSGSRSWQHRARQRAFEILEHGRRRSLAARLVDGLLITLILATVASVIARTVPEVAQRYSQLLHLVDRSCLLLFAVEYGVRIWVVPEHLMQTPHQQTQPASARLRFAATPMMVIDALALLPWLLELLLPLNAMVSLTRLITFLKLGRYSPALTTIGRVVAAERRALLACVIILGGVLLAAAAAMLAIEGDKQPGKFGDMPKTLWWAASMLAKIGGGEFEPVTALGRIVSAMTVMLGIFCFALPVAILGRGFYEEIRRRDFVVTFAMVARIPLFAQLDAGAIAGLVSLFRARTVSAGTMIVRMGDRGDAMYLIASGVVEVSVGAVVLRQLKDGDFFGEMALLARAPRSATITAVRTTDLLMLEADDFIRLVDRHPAIKDLVDAITHRRLHGSLEGLDGERDG